MEIHHPSADVVFQPGVAADGSSVAPADLPELYEAGMPDAVSFDLLLSPDGPGDLTLEGSVGVVTVEIATGAVLLNGRRIKGGSTVVGCENLPQTP